MTHVKCIYIVHILPLLLLVLIIYSTISVSAGGSIPSKDSLLGVRISALEEDVESFISLKNEDLLNYSSIASYSLSYSLVTNTQSFRLRKFHAALKHIQLDEFRDPSVVSYNARIALIFIYERQNDTVYFGQNGIMMYKQRIFCPDLKIFSLILSIVPEHISKSYSTLVAMWRRDRADVLRRCNTINIKREHQ